jgi:hypothetical protein
MKLSMRNIRVIVALLACGGLIAAGGTSIAQDESVIVEQPVLQPTEPMPMYEEMAAPAGAEIKALPVAKIDYDYKRRAKKRFRGSPMMDVVMVTENPADGCFYEIPLCLPACCTGAPSVESRCGLFGRGVVEYCWECGLVVEVKFRLRGDVEVEYGT